MVFRIKSSRSVVLGVLLIASGMTMLLGPAGSGRLRGMTHWAFAHFGDAGMYLTSRVKGISLDAKPLTEPEAKKLTQENAALKRRVDSLEGKVLQQNRILTGVTRGSVFSKLFGPNRDAPVKLVAARVVAADSLPYGYGRMLNSGSRNGAKSGLLVTTRALWTDRKKKLPQNFVVLSDSALVGRVMETKAFTARMYMVNDRAFEIRANIHRRINPKNPRQFQPVDRMVELTDKNNLPIEVSAYGDGTTGLIVTGATKSDNVLPGDVLQTKPNDVLLPAVVEIGIVARVTDNPKSPGRVDIYVNPSADLPSLRDVYIVVPEVAPARPIPGNKRGKK
jgi:cell shape-determining protein MreC